MSQFFIVQFFRMSLQHFQSVGACLQAVKCSIKIIGCSRMLDVRVSLQFQAKHKTCHTDDVSSGFGTAKKIYGHIKFFLTSV